MKTSTIVAMVWGILAGIPAHYVFGQGVEKPVSTNSTTVVETPPEPAKAATVATGTNSTNRPKPLDAGTAQLAEQVNRSSLDAFRRGLMPADAMLTRLSFVNSLRRTHAGDDQTALRQVADSQVEQLTAALEVAETLEQPNAEGWIAETQHLRIALAEAQLTFAGLTGDRAAAAVATAELQTAAAEYVEQVSFDHELGIASLPTLANAVAIADLAASDPNSVESVQRLLSINEGVLEQTSRWTEQGAGIGRRDLLHKAEAEYAATQLALSLLTKDTKNAPAVLQSADAAAKAMFDERLAFKSQGTSSLAGLTEAWLLRRQVHELAEKSDGLLTAPMAESLQNDLAMLETVAARENDARGRNRADIQFVQLIAGTLRPAAIERKSPR